MKFHGIDMQGQFKAQSVVDASALVWSADDERRVVYDEVTKQMWIADNVDWKNGGSDLPSGTEIWIYADSAPDGWTINATPSDELLAVKGGSTYVTGGTAAGSFTTPAHSHDMNSHIHNVSGNTGNEPHSGKDQGSGSNDCAAQPHYHPVNLNSGGASPSTTSIDGSSSAYRPLSRVGVICTRN